MKISLKLTPEEILRAVQNYYALKGIDLHGLSILDGACVSVEKDQFNNIISMTCVYEPRPFVSKKETG